jgi:hypothetical protein
MADKALRPPRDRPRKTLLHCGSRSLPFKNGLRLTLAFFGT